MRIDYGSGQRGHQATTRNTRRGRGLDASAVWTLMGAALLTACAHDESGFLGTESGGGGHGAVDVFQLFTSLAIAGGMIAIGSGGGGGGGGGPVADGEFRSDRDDGNRLTDMLSFSDPDPDNANSDLTFRIFPRAASQDRSAPAIPTDTELMNAPILAAAQLTPVPAPLGTATFGTFDFLWAPGASGAPGMLTWTYRPDFTEYEKLGGGEVWYDKITVTVSDIATAGDGGGYGDTKFLVVQLIGVNDSPMLEFVAPGSADEMGSVTNRGTGPAPTGTLRFGDVDDSDPNDGLTVLAGAAGAATEDAIVMPALAPSAFSPSGGDVVATVAGTYGTFTLTRDNMIAAAADGTDGSLVWSYDVNVNNQAVSGLPSGQTLVEKLFLRIDDGSGGGQSSLREVSIEITSNNLPTAARVGTGAVTINAKDNTATTAVTMNLADTDHRASNITIQRATTSSTSAEPDNAPDSLLTAGGVAAAMFGTMGDVAGTYGTFSQTTMYADSSPGVGSEGTVVWTYSLSNPGSNTALLALDETHTVYDKLTLRVFDGISESATVTMVVTIRGVNELPTAADNTITVPAQDGGATMFDDFTIADFGFMDPDDELASIKITALPTSMMGTLSLDASASDPGAVDLNQDIVAADIEHLTFNVAGGAAIWTGGPYTFDFSVNDGTADSVKTDYTITLQAPTPLDTGARGSFTVAGIKFEAVASSTATESNRFHFFQFPLTNNADSVAALQTGGIYNYLFANANNNPDFSQSNVAAVWEASPAVNAVTTATIIEAMTGLALADWQADYNTGTYSRLLGGSPIADKQAVAGTDFGGKGYLLVPGGTANTNPDGVVFSGDVAETGISGNGIADTRGTTATAHTQYTFVGTYGDLVLDNDGDWEYTLAGAPTGTTGVTYGTAAQKTAVNALTHADTSIGANGAETDDFTYTVAIGNEDQEFTLSITVQGLNMRPTGADVTKTTTPGQDFIDDFAISDFNFMDGDSDPLHSILLTWVHRDDIILTIDSDDDGTPERTLKAGDRILAAEIQHLVASHTTAGMVPTFNFFDFRVSDGIEDSDEIYDMAGMAPI